MRIIVIVALLCVAPSMVFAKSCASMTSELTRLRQEYRNFVNSPSGKSGSLTFEELVAVLDKIVELKNAMRRSNCKVPPRHPKGRETP